MSEATHEPTPAPATSDEELLGQLADDYTARRRRGEHPTADEYIAKYPRLAERIRKVLSAVGAIEQTVPFSLTASERIGSTIGRYKLLERIGEGGFGVVYMAEQVTPLRRKLALKVLKPGMDSGQVLARFEAERQALAIMDHPNIARVFDAGATDAGRPYFVMELVKGEPITAFCDRHQLTPRQRLELFAQVCHAVQHAHQKGIIHRDIKPTNVLVMMHDTEPVVKVIDFGIAKALGQELTEKTLFTGFAQLLGTPLYMSPEQAGQSAIDVDTRSDIYSLGVLLYELLTGTTPFDKERFRKAAQDEMRRIIREEEPPRPSTRLSESKDTLASVSAQRHTEPAKLAKLVRGELDWIVMKALEKDRSRRYETATGLARDIERYLRDETVEACPPSVVYRLRKIARRNKTALTVASIILGAMLVLIGTLAYTNRVITAERNEKAGALISRERALADAKTSEKEARKQADEAQAQRRRSERNFERARVTIRGISHIARGSGEWAQLSPGLRKQLTEHIMQFYESLLQEGSSDPAVRFETAVGYWSLAMNLDAAERERAEKLARQSILMLEALATDYPNFPEYRAQLAWANYVLASKLITAQRRADAEAAMRVSISLYEKLLTEAPRGEDPVDLVLVYLALGKLTMQDGRLEEAERAFRRSIAMHELQVTKYPDVDDNPHLYGASCAHLFKILVDRGQRREAADLIRSRLQFDPNGDGHHRWKDGAAMFLWIDDVDNYRWACREMLERFGDDATDNPEIADRIAWACCLAPDAVTDFSRVERLADRAVTGTESHGYRRQFNLTKGLAEYRRGHHEQAMEWLRQAAPQPNGIAFDAAVFAALAMSHHGLGHEDQARASLALARAIIAKKSQGGVDGWSLDWVRCEILCRETERLLAK